LPALYALDVDSELEPEKNTGYQAKKALVVFAGCFAGAVS
jgi:hypothetical protein